MVLVGERMHYINSFSQFLIRAYFIKENTRKALQGGQISQVLASIILISYYFILLLIN